MAVLVGKKAPDFTASAVINGEEIVEDFKLSDYAGKYVILFFYPKDFTFVCPTELHAFQARKAEFEAKGVELIAVSTCFDLWLLGRDCRADQPLESQPG